METSNLYSIFVAKSQCSMAVIKKISPCPIIEATIQVNCTFFFEPDLAVGLLFSSISNVFGIDNLRMERLPILNLPEELRRADPNLRDKPYYKINCGKYYILMGLYGLSFGVNPPYAGWEDFKRFSIKVFDLLKDNLVKGVSAISLKYLDFFKDINILEKANCSFSLNGTPITAIPTIFRTELPIDRFMKVIQITNGVHLRNPALRIDNDGSLIEIILFTKNVSKENFNQAIEDAHYHQKNSFFELLTDEYLQTYTVEYE